MNQSERPGPTAPLSPLAQLQAPATRREMLLFGLLILAIVWAFVSAGPRIVVVVPDTHVSAGVIT
jgi:hypothetical protein